MNMQMLSKKILDPDNLPQGPLTRFKRDLYEMSSIASSRRQTFEEWEKDYEYNYRKEIDRLNIENPIVIDKTYRLSEYKTLRIFKRTGQETSFFVCDTAPNGGCGYISL